MVLLGEVGKEDRVSQAVPAMRATLKSLDSPSLPADVGLENYEPPDPAFRLTIIAEVGSDEGEGADLFTFIVSTPDPLTDRSMGRGPRSHAWDRRVLFMREWSYDRLLEIISDLLSRCEGSDWNAIAEQLSPYMEWEFEDYRS